MIEQIPNWLKLLLAKYGEEQGPIIGLEEAPPPEYEEEPVDPSQLSNLLEQMADDPTPAMSPSGQAGTSVEWGQPPAESAGSIDSLLENLDVSPDAAYQPPAMPAAEPQSPADDDDVPDWLSSALEEAPDTADLLPDASSSTTDRETDADVPDWLTSALEESPSPQPAEETAPSPETTDDVPDWLTADTAAASPPAPPETTPTDDDDVPDWLSDSSSSAVVSSPDPEPAAPTDDVPDWLSESGPFTEDTPSDQDQPVAPMAEETDWPVPDWIQDETEETPPTTDQPDRESTVSGADIPDWIGDSPLFEGEESDGEADEAPREVPDWLTETEEPTLLSSPTAKDQEQATSTDDDWLSTLEKSDQETAPPPAAEPAAGDWLSDLRASIPDDPAEDEPAPDESTESADFDEPVDLPAWLTDAADPEPPAQPASPPEPQLPAAETPDVPDWLSQPEEDAQTPDWLTEAETSEVELPATPEKENEDEQPPELPDWLAGDAPDEEIPTPPETPPSDEPPLKIPSWLADDPVEASQPDVPAPSTETEPEAPAWLTEPPADSDDEAAPETPDWLGDTDTAPAPSAEAEPATETPTLPDWLDAPDEMETLHDTLPEEATTSEAPAWLADLPQESSPPDAVESLSAPTKDSPDAPDWLVGLQGAAAEMPSDTVAENPTEAETPDWLADLTQPTPVEEPTEDDLFADAPEPDLPDWLRGEPSEPSPPAEVTDDAPPTSTKEGDETAPPLDWLAADETSEEPDWLKGDDLASTAPGEAPVEAPTEDADTPDWLTADTEQDEPAAPDWLSEPTTTEPSTITPASESSAIETESPDWLADLSIDPQPVEADDSPSDEAPLDTSDWLAESSSIESQMESQTDSQIEGDAAPDTPDWLTDLQTETETVEESVAPSADWLTELGDVMPTEPIDAPASESAVDLDTPDWLSNLSEPESEAAETTDAPDWLTESAFSSPAEEAPTTSPKMADESPLPEFPEPADEQLIESAEPIESTATEPPEEPVFSEATDMGTEGPDWLANLRQGKADFVAAEPTTESVAEAETEETPDWLTDLQSESAADHGSETLPPPDEPPSSPAEAEAVPTGTQDSGDLPAWLTNLPDVDSDDVDIVVSAATALGPISSEVAALAKEMPPVEADDLPLRDQVEETATIEKPPVLPPETPTATPLDPTPPEQPDVETADHEPKQSMSSTERVPAESTPTEAAPEVLDDGPGWLADLQKAAADIPDDLDNLSETIDSEPTVDDEMSGTDEATPDWLTDHSPAADSGETVAEFDAVIPADEPESSASLFDDETETDEAEPPDTDWLSELSTTEEETTAHIDDQETDTEPAAPDWLSRLSTEVAEPTATVDEQEVDAEPAAPDWLSELPDAPKTGTLDSADTQVETKSTTPDWLSELPADEPTPETDSEEEPTAPDWLNELPAEEVEPVPTVDEQETDEEPAAPDWLSELPDAPKTGALDSPDTQVDDEPATPDWLAELPAEEAEPTATADEQEVQAEPDAPDWLSELPDAPQTGTLDSADTQVDEAPTTPDWLSELPADTPPPETDGDEEPTAPDWLSELPAEEVEPVATTVDDQETDAEPATPDWLNELPADEPPSETDSDDEPTAPDWLSGLSTEHTEPTAIADDQETDAEPDDPNWLEELPGDEPAAETGGDEEPATPDWLGGLSTEGAEPIVIADDQEADTEADAPDWLGDLSTEDAEPAATRDDQETQAEPAAPDWLSGLTDDEPTAEADSGAEPTSPDWLAEAGSETETEAFSDVVAEPDEAESDTPTWLTGLRQAEASAEPADWGEEAPDTEPPPEMTDEPAAATDTDMDASETPTWLTGLRQAEPEPLTDADEASNVEAKAETPDWLADLSEDAPQPPEDTPSESTPDTPGWLADLGQAETPTEGDIEDIEETAPVESPDWLDNLAAETEPVEGEETVSPEPSAIGDEDAAPEPDWLSDLAGDEDAITPTVETETSEFDSEPALPDWLSDSDSDSSFTTDEPSAATEVDLPEPDWLSDATTATTTPTAEAAEATDSAPETTGEDEPPTPDWMSGLREATHAVRAGLPEEQVDSFDELVGETETSEPTTDEAPFDFATAPAETPDWLQDLEDDEPDEAEATSDQSPPTNLIDLPPTTETESIPLKEEPVKAVSTAPNWLGALRQSGQGQRDDVSVEEMADDTQAAESTGLMTDFAPLLPAEKMTTSTSMAAAALVANQPGALSEAARRFHAIATQAPQAVTVPETLTQPQSLISNLPRLLTYLLFILLVALPLLPGLRATDYEREATWTEPIGQRSDDLDQQRRAMISEPLGIIDQQQPESVALVSFDFSTATQGEMQPLAEAIVGRLSGQGLRLIFVSLEPEGAALAQQMLDKLIAERGEPYRENVSTRGYQPGQMAGIRDLLTAGGDEGSDLSQVDLVVTIADNPATARWWVEQMALIPESDNQERFLLAATSATAAPFLQPYEANDQLDGLIVGLNGAAAIEAGRREFGLARQMLDSQSIAHLLLVIVIFAGIIAGWMPPLYAEEPVAPKEEAAQPEPTPPEDHS